MLTKEMLRFVEKVLPSLSIDEVQTINQGWDNDILIINKEIVFRFPKSEQFLTQVQDECVILQQLALKKTVLKIPRYEMLYSGGKLKAVKYSFLQGQSLNENSIKNLNKNPENAKVISNFLSKLHSISLSELKKTHLHTIHTLDYWETLYASVKNHVFPILNSQQQDEVNEVFINFISNYPKFSYKKAVIHGDLSASNMLYDEEDGCLSGIIDFTDAQIGDPAFDFAGLYWNFGPDFTKKVLSYYCTNESKGLLFDRVSSFYGLQPVFHEWLHAIKTNQKMDWKSTFEKFSELRNGANNF